ncbi:MAG: tetratricopeptide repeat protein [Planctomycetota bacterium]|jgi:tetratricopeptide (TPR) repeat protein
MTPQDENVPGGIVGDAPSSLQAGRGSLLPWIAGVVSLILVGGTTVAVIIVHLVSGPPRDGIRREVPPSEAATVPSPSRDTGAGEEKIGALRDRIADLELEVMRLRSRIKEMDAATVDRLSDRILTGDPESVKGAREILERRGGTLGKTLTARLLALRARVVELEAAVEIEKEKAEAAIRDLLELRKKAADEGRKWEKSKAAEYYELGLKAQEGGHNLLAEEYYTRSLEIDPALASALNGRGMVRMAMSRYREALADFTTSATLRPDFMPYEFNRGRALSALKRHAEAEKAFDKVLVLDPGNEKARKARDEARARQE